MFGYLSVSTRQVPVFLKDISYLLMLTRKRCYKSDTRTGFGSFFYHESDWTCPPVPIFSLKVCFFKASVTVAAESQMRLQCSGLRLKLGILTAIPPKSEVLPIWYTGYQGAGWELVAWNRVFPGCFLKSGYPRM